MFYPVKAVSFLSLGPFQLKRRRQGPVIVSEDPVGGDSLGAGEIKRPVGGRVGAPWTSVAVLLLQFALEVLRSSAAWPLTTAWVPCPTCC